MTPLIAMPGPWLPDDADDARAGGMFPDLPALTQLLQRARRLPDVPDWRAGVLAALGGGSDVAPVAVAARAIPDLAADAPLCFAAPLHVVAGMSRVHLSPGGRLLLEPPEEQAWCEGFNQEFGAGGLRLHVASPGGGWLLSAPFALAARDTAPEALVGAALERQPAADAAERALRRLGAEVEMWLAAHPLNRAREARRQPPLNAIWFWGGAKVAALSALVAPRTIVDGGALPDAWLMGLAGHLATPVVIRRGWGEAMRDVDTAGGAGPLLVVLGPDGGGPTGRYWQMLEDQWFAPVAQALKAGTISSLQLQVGRGGYVLPHRSLPGWLRWQRRSWWQLTGQARP